MCFLCSCSTTKNLPEGEILYTGVRSIDYDWAPPADTVWTEVPDSTRSYLKAEVDAALNRAPNNSIFGSSSVRWPLPLGLWFYNRYVNSERRFGKWMFSTFAATPVTISNVNPTMRTQVARQVMRANGFFQGTASSTIIPNPKDERKARVAYTVQPGPVYRLDSIAYEHFCPATDSIIRQSMSRTLIHREDPFRAALLDSERQRLSKLFRNNGFFYYKPEYITYLADTVQRQGHVQLRVQPSPEMPPQARNRYHIGRTTITVFPYDNFVITDSTNNPNHTLSGSRRLFRRAPRLLTAADSARFNQARNNFIMRWGGGEKTPLRLGAVRQYLIYEPGQLYRQGLHDFIQNQLSGMGIFSSLQMNYAPRDTMPDCDTLDVNIFAVLDKPYDSELEAKITNKTNGLLGPGVAWGITKRNAFRGAESLNFKIYGSYEWQIASKTLDPQREKLVGSERSFMNSFELGTTLSLQYPRLMPRFLQRMAFRRQRRQVLAGKTARRTFATTTYKIDVDWLNRASYFQVLKFGGDITYNFQRSPWLRHELTPLKIEYSKILHMTPAFALLSLYNPSMYASMEEKIVPSIGYTLTYSPRTRNRHSRIISVMAKEAGNLTNAIYALAGRDYNEQDKHLLGAPFAQYFKLAVEWRETWPVSPRTTLATRLFAGAIWSYGNSDEAPIVDMFYSGGANSIRAFHVRSLGPGHAISPLPSWDFVFHTGDIKLEANAEWRFPIVGGLNGALFLDAGNVWLMRPGEIQEGGTFKEGNFFKDIALGTGFGFRYDFDFLVLRFDIGVGIHAPYDTGRSGYYNMPSFWKSLGFNFAVGYPF